MPLLKVSTVNQARWARFCHNRRGFWLLWIFLVIFVLALLSNVLANDKPLLARYQGHWFVPFMVNYSETTFGGELETPADYQDPFVLNQLEDHGWVLWVPIRSSFNSINFATTQPFPSPPSAPHGLGTKSNRHGLPARLLSALRTSLLSGILLTLFSSPIGVSP